MLGSTSWMASSPKVLLMVVPCRRGISFVSALMVVGAGAGTGVVEVRGDDGMAACLVGLLGVGIRGVGADGG